MTSSMGLLSLPIEVQRNILDHVSSNVSLPQTFQLHGLHFVSLLRTTFLLFVRALFMHKTS